MVYFLERFNRGILGLYTFGLPKIHSFFAAKEYFILFTVGVFISKHGKHPFGETHHNSTELLLTASAQP